MAQAAREFQESRFRRPAHTWSTRRTAPWNSSRVTCSARSARFTISPAAFRSARRPRTRVSRRSRRPRASRPTGDAGQPPQERGLLRHREVPAAHVPQHGRAAHGMEARSNWTGTSRSATSPGPSRSRASSSVRHEPAGGSDDARRRKTTVGARGLGAHLEHGHRDGGLLVGKQGRPRARDRGELAE